MNFASSFFFITSPLIRVPQDYENRHLLKMNYPKFSTSEIKKLYSFIEGKREIGYKNSTMETWRLLDTGARSAAENMALDETLLGLKSEERIPHTLRFLQFSNPTVLVGHHQSVEEEVRLGYCRTQGIEINRRLTGDAKGIY